MDRRTYLRGAAVTGTTLVAGCLGRADDETVLDAPDDQGADSENLPYPAYGEEFPESTLPDPLRDREVSTAEFEGERVVLMTFLFTRCPDGVCPGLTQVLRHAQADAIENDYADEVALLATTFDVERDTPEVLREYGESQGVDYEAENWYFLRPESADRAREVVTETTASSTSASIPNSSRATTRTTRWASTPSTTTRSRTSSTARITSSAPTPGCPRPRASSRTSGRSPTATADAPA